MQFSMISVFAICAFVANAASVPAKGSFASCTDIKFSASAFQATCGKTTSIIEAISSCVAFDGAKLICAPSDNNLRGCQLAIGLFAPSHILEGRCSVDQNVAVSIDLDTCLKVDAKGKLYC